MMFNDNDNDTKNVIVLNRTGNNCKQMAYFGLKNNGFEEADQVKPI
jgi:hypothetical protein